MKRPRWACCERWLALLAWGLAVAGAPAAAAEPVRIERADFVLADTATPPGPEVPWQSVVLPDSWDAKRPGVSGVGWYRLSFTLAQAPERPQALYTPRLRAVGQVFLNGQPVGWSGVAQAPERASRVPQLFALPMAWLRTGTNEIHVRVEGLRGYGNGLAAVTVGDDQEVRLRYEWRWLLQITGAQMSFALTSLFGLFSLLLWWRRREAMHLWFGLSMLCFAVYTTSAFVRHPPLQGVAWETFGDLAAYAKMSFLALFALRFAGLRWPRTERVLWGLTAAAVVATLLWHPLGLRHPAVDLVTDVAWRFASVVCFAALALAAWRQRDAEHVLVALSATVHPVVTIHTFGLLPSVGLAHQVAFDALSATAYDFLPMLLVITWALVGRFVASLHAAERLNAELERRVEVKHAELERNYQRLHRLEQQQAVAAERERITRDMHDGIGGQLISTLSLVEHGRASAEQVAEALRECIDDLRLAIDSLEPADEDLLPILGSLRYRLEPRLKASGVALDWQVSELPRLASLTPQNVLHILRILQEAFTNVLKHAQADCVAVETGVEPDSQRVYIRVRDNGHGFGGLRPGGRGLANMLRRAKAVGGELQVRPSPQGTTLELLLPVG